MSDEWIVRARIPERIRRVGRHPANYGAEEPGEINYRMGFPDGPPECVFFAFGSPPPMRIDAPVTLATKEKATLVLVDEAKREAWYEFEE